MTNKIGEEIYKSLFEIMPRKKDFLNIKLRDDDAYKVVADYAANHILDWFKDDNIPDDAKIYISETTIVSFIITDEDDNVLEMIKMEKMDVGINSAPYAIGYITLTVGYSKVMNRILIGVGELYPKKEEAENA